MKSRSGRAEPYSDPITRRSMRGIDSAGSSSTASSAGIPISTAVPRRRVERNAARIASLRPVASIATSTPPPDASRTRSAVSSAVAAAWTASVAPSDSAASSRPSCRSTAMIGAAPTAARPITADRPTPPQPITAARWPARTCALRQTAQIPVVTAQPTSAATSAGTSSGIGTHDASGSTVRSAKDEMNE